MSEEPARKFHALTWTLSIVAVALVYLISYPWVWEFWNKYDKKPYIPADVLTYFGTPYWWIGDSFPLFRKPMDSYVMWCAGIVVGDGT